MDKIKPRKSNQQLLLNEDEYKRRTVYLCSLESGLRLDTTLDSKNKENDVTYNKKKYNKFSLYTSYSWAQAFLTQWEGMECSSHAGPEASKKKFHGTL